MPHWDAVEPPAQPNEFKFVDYSVKTWRALTLPVSYREREEGGWGGGGGTKDETIEEGGG